MEINTQPLESLLNLREQQALPGKKESVPVQAFEKVFNEQLSQNETRTNEIAGADAMQTALLSQLKLEKSGAVAGDMEQDALMAAFEQASGVLNQWDEYARILGGASSDASLRDAWSALEGLDSNIANLRANPLAGSNAALDGLINELEVMAAAEKFKFNRGDYLG
ncbi:MAG: hypothetical protein K2H64_11575 [Desulfovibrio sp.]|nr:hypothetical protein [Desulfovibrio sp.]